MGVALTLTPYRPSKYKSQQKPPPPPPIQTKEGEEHEVDHICDSCTRRGRTEYLVHWKGYPQEDDTWEPASNLKHAQHVLKDFLNSRPSPQILRHLRSEPSSDPKLFDWNATEPTLIQKTQDETTDILLRTTVETMDDILAQRRIHLELSSPIGITVKRVWFLEGPPVNAATVATLVSTDDTRTRLTIDQLYQHSSPIESSRIAQYIQRPLNPKGPTLLPHWFARMN